MSDLQCAARLIVVNPPALADVAWLASAIHLEKVQAVYAADAVPDTGPVETLADGLGVPAPLGHGDLAAESAGFDEHVQWHPEESVLVVVKKPAPTPMLLLV